VKPEKAERRTKQEPAPVTPWKRSSETMPGNRASRIQVEIAVGISASARALWPAIFNIAINFGFIGRLSAAFPIIYRPSLFRPVDLVQIPDARRSLGRQSRL